MTTLSSETFTGTTGAAWPATFTTGLNPTTGGGATIQTNAGRLTTGSTSGYNAADIISRRWNITAPTNAVWQCRFRFTGDEMYPRMFLRSTNLMDAQQGYDLSFDLFDPGYHVSTFSAYSEGATLGSKTFSYTANTWYQVVFGAVGTAIKAVMWADATPIPSAWDIQATDSTFTGSGAVGLYCGSQGSGLGKFEIDDAFVFDSFPALSVAGPTPVVVPGVTSIGTININFGTSVSAVKVSGVTTVGAPTGMAALPKPATVAGVASVGVPSLSALAPVAVVQGVTTVNAPTGMAALPKPVTVAGVTAVGAPTGLSNSITAVTVAGVTAIGAPSITVGGGATVNAVKVSGVTTIGAPAFSALVTAATTVAGTTTVGSPAILLSVAASPAVVPGVTAVGSPSISTGAAAAPSRVQGIASVGAPSITVGGGSTASPSTVAGTTAIGSPALLTSSMVTPTTVAGAASVGSPSVSGQSNVTVVAATVAGVSSIAAPAVQSTAGATANTTTVQGVSSIPTPSIQISRTASVATVAGVSSIPTPTVTASAFPGPAAVVALTTIPLPQVKGAANTGTTALALKTSIPIPSILTTKPPVSMPGRGGWYSLIDVYREAEQYLRDDASAPAIACPIDGTTLLSGPHGETYCPWDGWRP